jgi:hypothetical protein
MIGKEINAYIYGSKEANTDIKIMTSNCLARFGEAVSSNTMLIRIPVKIRLFIGTSCLLVSEKISETGLAEHLHVALLTAK